MADFLTPSERSKLMSKIRGRDTGPELKMAAALDTAGISYERYADLPGTPDFVIGSIVLMVDGDFWHGKNFWPRRSKLKPFWFDKIANNIRRDRRVRRKLRSMGYTILNIWESDLKDIGRCIGRVQRAIDRVGIRPYVTGA